MERPGPAQPAPSSSSATENPVVAAGRKVKTALSTHQKPSVRIRRSNADLYSTTAATDFETRRDLSETHAAHIQAHQPALEEEEEELSGRFGAARKRISAAFGSLFGQGKPGEAPMMQDGDEYDEDMVDFLDVVDPEVSTLSTLTNVQNSLFIPSVPLINRRATYRLSDRPRHARMVDKLKAPLKAESSTAAEQHVNAPPDDQASARPALTHSATITSTLSESRYAVLPHGQTLDGWTREEKEMLNDLVRHMLHSRRARFKRSMRGFVKYVQRPLGLFVTVYATLITLFGAAWVLFLIGWISLGSKKDYVINVVDNVLVALFAIIGDGLAPFRAVDTYHMIYIAKYHRKTWKKREKMGLPELADRNDLPDQRKEEVNPDSVDLESLVARRLPKRLARAVAPRIPKRLARKIASNSSNYMPGEYTVLTDEEQAKLEHHERKFSKSHTFYKPHETETHYAFPIKLLVAIVVLLDLHSCLQITLGVSTWSMENSRPFALTTVVLCCSITCNIMGGVLISVGDKRTRKKDVIERMMRQELTAEAMEDLEKRWMKEAEERGEIDKSVRRRIEDEKDEAENEEIKKAWKGVPSLPKKLLGKGEDHRQASLPQNMRRSNRTGSGMSTDSSKSKSKRKSTPPALASVQEDVTQPARPEPAARRAEEPSESTGQRVLRLFRRADLDRS